MTHDSPPQPSNPQKSRTRKTPDRGRGWRDSIALPMLVALGVCALVGFLLAADY